MSEQKRSDESGRAQAPGDVETAGETTAADTIEGPEDTRPVGSETTAPVEGEPEPSRRKGD